MNKHFLLLFILFLTGCKTEKIVPNISCEGTVTVQYDKKKSGDEQTVKKGTKGYVVYFINTFDDQIEAYVDGKLYFNHYIKIDDSSDDLSNYFSFIPQQQKIPLLKIISKTQNTCFDISINKKYKIIYIFLSREGKWIVRFSNVYYMI